MIENMHIKASVQIKTLKLNLGRLKLMLFRAGKELYRSEKEEDMSTSSLLVISSTEGKLGIWSIEDFLDQALEEPNEHGVIEIEPTCSADLGMRATALTIDEFLGEENV